MKNYKNTEQALGVGDVARLGNTMVKIIHCIQDEKGNWSYKVEAINLAPPARLTTNEVPQDALEEI